MDRSDINIFTGEILGKAMMLMFRMFVFCVNIDVSDSKIANLLSKALRHGQLLNTFAWNSLKAFTSCLTDQQKYLIYKGLLKLK